MPSIPPPPVPQKLREMLKDYPEHLDEIQKTLNDIVEKPPHGTPPFEMAVWMLEDTLSAFVSEASEKLKAAETSGNAQAIAKAEAKQLLMFRARSGSAGGGLLDLNELKTYFDANSEVFQ